MFLQLLDRVLEAVTDMHSQETVQLDIKPCNVLVRPGNDPVISDLGFAKLLVHDEKKTMTTTKKKKNTFLAGTEG